MRFNNALYISEITDKCFAAFDEEEGCSCLIAVHDECGGTGCPFYKPSELRDWIRLEGRDGVMLVPPEEYKEACS